MFETFSRNQDLFRGSIQSMNKQAIAKALLWLHGDTLYPYPISIHLNLTLRCSARCLHCKQWTWPIQSEFTISQLHQLFSIFKRWGVKTITFGGGNPLLYKHIGLALRIANQANIQIGITSEGSNISEELAETICQCASWIRFSLDGHSADIHDKIRNAPGLFDNVIRSINQLQTYQSKLRIGLNCVVQKRNVNILSQMLDLAERLKIDTLLFKMSHGNDTSGHFLLSVDEWKQFEEWVNGTSRKRKISVRTNLNELCAIINYIFTEKDVIQGRPVRSFYINEQVHCFAPLFFLSCDSEGNMYPCDYLHADTRVWEGEYGDMRRKFCLGNVLDDSQQVLNKLAMMFRNTIHNLPTITYDECGCCTRFFQLNAVLSKMKRDLNSRSMTEQSIIKYLTKFRSEQPESNFL